MKDLTLGDLGWIFGSMLVFMFSCILIRLAYDHRHVLKAIWRQSRMSGVVCVNIVRDFDEPQHIMSPILVQTTPDQQTDRQTDPVSEADQWLDRLEVDRTRTAIIELMVYSGWATGEIRTVIKGDNGAIGAEVDAAKKRLGIIDEPRQLRVKDDKGERLIPMEVP